MNWDNWVLDEKYIPYIKSFKEEEERLRNFFKDIDSVYRKHGLYIDKSLHEYYIFDYTEKDANTLSKAIPNYYGLYKDITNTPF